MNLRSDVVMNNDFANLSSEEQMDALKKRRKELELQKSKTDIQLDNWKIIYKDDGEVLCIYSGYWRGQWHKPFATNPHYGELRDYLTANNVEDDLVSISYPEIQKLIQDGEGWMAC